MRGEGIKDEHLDRLDQLPGLVHLFLFNTSITDDGLSHLTRLGSLEWLDIYENPGITDDGLSYLSQYPKLSLVRFLKNPGLTDEAIEKLRKDLPNVDIINFKEE